MKKANNIYPFIFFFVITIIFTPQITHSQELSITDMNAIIAVLNFQETKWNEGNIPGYMEGYVKSDSLKFITKKGVTHGWENTLLKYQKSYPDKAAMGDLKFEIISIEALCERKALMTGKWTLHISGQNNLTSVITGYFTLIWQNFDGKWLITVDHTS
jgi:hypothetical protein